MDCVVLFETFVLFGLPLATTNTSAMVSEVCSLAFPDGFGPDLLLLSPPASGERVSLVGFRGGAVAPPPYPCKDMVIGIGFHGGHRALLPRKRMTDRNTTTSSSLQKCVLVLEQPKCHLNLDAELAQKVIVHVFVRFLPVATCERNKDMFWEHVCCIRHDIHSIW